MVPAPPATPAPPYQLNIRTPQGNTHTFNFVPNATVVGEVKNQLRLEQGVPLAYKLIFNCKELADGHTLSSCGVKDGDTVHLLPAVRPVLKEFASTLVWHPPVEDVFFEYA